MLAYIVLGVLGPPLVLFVASLKSATAREFLAFMRGRAMTLEPAGGLVRGAKLVLKVFVLQLLVMFCINLAIAMTSGPPELADDGPLVGFLSTLPIWAICAVFIAWGGLEELVFRAVPGAFARRIGTPTAFYGIMLGANIAFALAHLLNYAGHFVANLPYTIAAFTQGLFLVYLYRKGGYWCSAAAHMFFNAVMLGGLFAAEYIRLKGVV